MEWASVREWLVALGPLAAAIATAAVAIYSIRKQVEQGDNALKAAEAARKEEYDRHEAREAAAARRDSAQAVLDQLDALESVVLAVTPRPDAEHPRVVRLPAEWTHEIRECWRVLRRVPQDEAAAVVGKALDIVTTVLADRQAPGPPQTIAVCAIGVARDAMTANLHGFPAPPVPKFFDRLHELFTTEQLEATFSPSGNPEFDWQEYFRGRREAGQIHDRSEGNGYEGDLPWPDRDDDEEGMPAFFAYYYRSYGI